jgi:hypothetical protein
MASCAHRLDGYAAARVGQHQRASHKGNPRCTFGYQHGNVARLTIKELEVLLRWKGVPVSKMGNMASKRALYQHFVGDRGEDDLGNPARWTEADDDHLEALRIVPIEMGDTAYGRFEAQKKRDVEITYQKMSAEEKESFKQKMAEIDNTGTGYRQSPPPSPTPV